MLSEFIIHCNQFSTALILATIAASYFQHSLHPMASGAKTALVFMLMAAMAMAAQATSHHVSCKNEYCKPIKVNGVVIDVGVTATVLVDNVLQTLTCEVPDILGNVVVSTCTCPSEVTAVAVVALDLDIVVKVIACTLQSLLGTILATIKLTLAVCL